MSLSVFAGMYNADQFAYGWPSSKAGVLQVTQGSTSTGAYTIVCAPTSLQTIDGITIPISTSTPIMIGSDSGLEIVTPTAVSTNNLGGLLITATFSNAHGVGAQVRSGDAGLGEAMAAAFANGGGQVLVSAGWFRNGGTQAILNAATQYAGVTVQNTSGTGGTIETQTVTLTAAQVNTMFTTPIQLLPTPDAASFYLINWATFVNKNGGTAWTGGGVIEVGYGATLATEALSGTVAATFLTSPVVTQVTTLAGINPLTSGTASTYLAKPIYINNATAVFATGTGVLEITLQYQRIST